MNGNSNSVEYVDGIDNVNSIRYTDNIRNIRSHLYDTAESACYIGYNLYVIQSENLFLDGGYNDIYDFGKHELNFSRRSINRFLDICLVYSAQTIKKEPTDQLRKEYSQFSCSALAEMLNLDEKKKELITPDMTVKQIREYKKDVIFPVEDTNSINNSFPVTKTQDANDCCDRELVLDDEEFHVGERIFVSDLFEYSTTVKVCKTVQEYVSIFGNVSKLLNEGYLIRLCAYAPKEK